MSARRPGASPRCCAQAAAGFTLVELLVAITLLGMLAALVFGGFRFGNRAWERAQAHVDHASEIQLAQSFLRRRLGTAAPVRKRDEGREQHLEFDGEASRLSFVTVMPVHRGTGGYARLELEFKRTAEAGELLLTWRPYRFGSQADADEDEGDVRALLRQVDEVTFAYYGPRRDDRDEPLTWSSSWRERRQLPRLIRVRLKFANGDRRHWPELVVAPAVNRASPNRR